MDWHAFAATLQLLALLVLPGSLVLLGLADAPRRLSVFLLSAASASLILVFLASLGLLHASAFGPRTLWLSLSPLLLVPALRPGAAWRRLRRIRPDPDLLPALCAAAVYALLLLATPKWNFLISFGMDAGNYENYSNHFWRSGSLYFDYAEYLRGGVPAEWISYPPDWDFGAWDGRPARPLFFYAYPVLLAGVKALYGSPTVAWVLNAVLAALCVYALGLIAARLVPDRLLSPLLTLAACLSPIFYYYSKQIMSEQLALFGVLALVVGVLENARRPTAASLVPLGAGLALALLSKLDVLVTPVFLGAGLLWLWLERLQGGRELPLSPGALGVLGLTSLLCMLFIHAVYVESYLDERLPFPGFEGATGVPLVAAYGAAVGAGFLLLARWARSLGGWRRGLGRALAAVDARRWMALALSLGWLAFLAWNVFVRPGVPGSRWETQDALNLVRLSRAAPPLLFAVFVLGLPAILTRARDLWRALLIAFALQLAFLIYDARHSTGADVWLMRRYLAPLLPALVIAGGLLLGGGRRRWSGVRGRVALAAVLGLVLLAQYPALDGFLRHAVNPEAPSRIETVRRAIPAEAVLIVTRGDLDIDGMGNTLRYLRSAPTVLGVPRQEIDRALALWPERPVALLTPEPLDRLALRRTRLRRVASGVFERDWRARIGEIQGTLRRLRWAAGSESSASEYHLYLGRQAGS